MGSSPGARSRAAPPVDDTATVNLQPPVGHGGENPEALDLAQKIIDDQQAENSEMEQLLETL